MRCNECLWSNQCWTNEPCTDFFPINIDYDEIIEERRQEFEREWEEYSTVMDD